MNALSLDKRKRMIDSLLNRMIDKGFDSNDIIAYCNLIFYRNYYDKMLYEFVSQFVDHSRHYDTRVRNEAVRLKDYIKKGESCI